MNNPYRENMLKTTTIKMSQNEIIEACKAWVSDNTDITNDVDDGLLQFILKEDGIVECVLTWSESS